MQTKEELYDRLRGMDYQTRAKYINKVKEGASGREDWNLVELEIDDYIDELNRLMATEADPTKLAVIAARIQGATVMRNRIFEKWTIRDKESNDGR